MTVAYDLSGKAAVVTGGAKGIGRAVAERVRGGSGAGEFVHEIFAAFRGTGFGAALTQLAVRFGQFTFKRFERICDVIAIA